MGFVCYTATKVSIDDPVLVSVPGTVAGMGVPGTSTQTEEMLGKRGSEVTREADGRLPRETFW